jgi:DNA invertase Pin-like site-specific DNA recombinase
MSEGSWTFWDVWGMANVIGYARVSSADQDCAIQEAALRVAGATIVRSEKISATSSKGRAELETILDFLQAGDTLMVTRIDRLARSVADLERIVASVKAAGAFLRTTEQPIDTSTPAGTAFLQMLGVFAQFETALRRERQMEGISRAKAEGRYKGRPATVDVIKVRELHSNGVTPSGIAKRLAIGRASVYRALAKTKAA